MIEILELQDPNIFGLKINGTFTKEDVGSVFETLIAKTEREGRVRLYYEVNELDLGSLSKDMIGDEMKFLFNHPMVLLDIEKAVLVTDLDWLRKLVAVEFALIPTLSGKAFTLNSKADAMAWLEADHRSENQMDIVFPELTQLGAVKALGGFGIGMLAANALTRGQRTKIGTVAVVGGILLGLPLAAKLLNNNRQLFRD